jgi:hypothetical protein
MARRLDKTLVDYLVIAISPALIMALVGSLVLFLTEVFYRGNFQGRLEYIFALFVVGAVLVGRISIESGREHAVLFALPLGIVTLLAINRFVEFQGGILASLSFFINLGLIALVWWSADKLTWDCTVIDEGQEDSGEGLLEAVGLDKGVRGETSAERRAGTDERGEGRKEWAGDRLGAPTAGRVPAALPSPPSSWWQRFIERRRRPHAAGVWVVYFSLAALPLFGLGQLRIPASDRAARQGAFQLLCVYVGSGLGLLLSTSFLGLRRYLRQRHQEMPLAMTGRWLGIGWVLIAGVMLAALCLPRPNAEYAISELPFRVGSPDQTSSPYGMGRDGVDEIQPWARGRQPEGPRDDQRGRSDGASRRRDGASADEKGQSPGKQGSAGQGGKDGQRQSGDRSKSDEQSRGTNSGRSAEDGKKDAGQRKSGAAGPTDAGQRKPGEAPPENTSPPGSSGQDRSNAGRPQQRGGPRFEGHPPPRAVPSFRNVADLPATFISLLKWLFYAALGLVVALLVWKNRRELWSALMRFFERLSDFWRRLFGRRGGGADAAATDGPKAAAPKRFADFANPFVTGLAGRCPPEVLVQYSFEAFEAWARDRGHPRGCEQTPHEFAGAAAGHDADLADDALRLADLYCQVAYSRRGLSATAATSLPRLWQAMSASSAVACPP